MKHRLFSIAALGVQLRWALSRNRLRRRGKRTRRVVVVAATTYTIANIVLLASVRYVSDTVAANMTILLMASMAMGWVFGPVLIGGVDETVDPTRLALLPLSGAERYVMQLAAAMSGTGPMAATVGLVIGLTLGHGALGPALVVVPVAATVAVLMMVGSARALAATLTIAQRSRAGRDAAVLLAATAGAAIFTMAQLARDVVDVGGSWLIEALSWVPWAWPARAINAARAGDEAGSFAWLFISVVAALAVHGGWAWLSNFLLLNGERSARTRRRGSRAILNGAKGAFGAALSRQWIYLWRSPNSRVGMVFGTVFGVAFAVVQTVQQGFTDSGAAAFSTLLAMLANLGAATNVLGFDAGSMWIEVLANGPTRTNMVARQLIALPNLLIPTWLAGLVVGVWTGQWTLVLLVGLLAVPVAINVLTFGLITSVVAPAPLPDLDNPFGNRQANDSRAIRVAAIAIGGMVTISVLSAPMFILAVRWLDRWWMWLTPLLGLVYASLLFALVAGWVGRFLRGREPSLIERLAPRALN